MDTTPTENSPVAVTSDGIYKALNSTYTADTGSQIALPVGQYTAPSDGYWIVGLNTATSGERTGGAVYYNGIAAVIMTEQSCSANYTASRAVYVRKGGLIATQIISTHGFSYFTPIHST
jgi:hypothetical protein